MLLGDKGTLSVTLIAFVVNTAGGASEIQIKPPANIFSRQLTVKSTLNLAFFTASSKESLEHSFGSSNVTLKTILQNATAAAAGAINTFLSGNDRAPRHFDERSKIVGSIVSGISSATMYAASVMISKAVAGCVQIVGNLLTAAHARRIGQLAAKNSSAVSEWFPSGKTSREGFIEVYEFASDVVNVLTKATFFTSFAICELIRHNVVRRDIIEAHNYDISSLEKVQRTARMCGILGIPTAVSVLICQVAFGVQDVCSRYVSSVVNGLRSREHFSQKRPADASVGPTAQGNGTGKSVKDLRLRSQSPYDCEREERIRSFFRQGNRSGLDGRQS